MLTGRKFAARFKNSSAREAYLTWSAGQMFIYNECVLDVARQHKVPTNRQPK